jgi:hypothetical protein
MTAASVASTETPVVSYRRTFALPLRLPGITVSFVESYYAPAFPPGDSDVFACLCHDRPIGGWRTREGATRLIDLGQDSEGIFSALDKGTRYEVNRAGTRDQVETAALVMPAPAEVDEFMNYYDRFADSKGVPRIRRSYVEGLRDAGHLGISTARDRSGAILAAHAYILGGSRARLSHSASLFRLEESSRERALVGRANRLLHWRDLLHFQGLGFEHYDFGGWYTGSSNEALIRINAFKGEFGGRVVHEWSSYRAGSIVGRFYLALRDRRLRGSRA